MAQVYKKRDKVKIRNIFRYIGLGVCLFGVISFLYITFPLLSWKLYFEPAFAATTVQTPIPQATVLSKDGIQNFLASAVQSVNVNYDDAQNWFPATAKININNAPIVTTYNISIPKLSIKYANVSTIDTDLSKHLIHYPGTPLPSEKGNSVILGHSTLPNLFNPLDYKTIFAKAHTLEVGDNILVTINAKEHTFEVTSLSITTADDTSVFSQGTNENLLTLITCTPPGTTWKRLIIKARLNKGLGERVKGKG